MTARDGSATLDASGMTRLSDKTTQVEINAKANAGAAVLYTPSGGLQGFASLQALEIELNRRHTEIAEFESLLELLSPTDLMRVHALSEKAETSLEFPFKEMHGSVFEYWFNRHRRRPSGRAPATPPGMRVRTGRFEKLRSVESR